MQIRAGAMHWATWLLVVAGLTACGGGADDATQPARTQAAPLLQSEAWVQPSGVQAQVGVKARGWWVCPVHSPKRPSPMVLPPGCVGRTHRLAPRWRH